MNKLMNDNPWRTRINVAFVFVLLAGSLALSMLTFGQLLGLVET